MMTRGRRESDPDKDDERERERNLLIAFFRSAKTTRYARRSALQNWIFENLKSLLSVFLNLAMKPMDAAPLFLSLTLDAQ